MPTADELKRSSYNCFKDLAQIAESGPKFERMTGKVMGDELAIDLYITRLDDFLRCVTGDLVGDDDVVSKVEKISSQLADAKAAIVPTDEADEPEASMARFKTATKPLTRQFSGLISVLNTKGLPVKRCDRLAGAKNEVRRVLWPRRKAI